MSEWIASLIGFIFDNIGFIIGLLVILWGFSASKKKKKRAHQEGETNPEAPKTKSFRDIVAEMQRELEEEKRGDFEPNIPYEPQQTNNRPWDAPVKKEALGKKQVRQTNAPKQNALKESKIAAPHVVEPHTVVHQSHLHVNEVPTDFAQPADVFPIIALADISQEELVRGIVMSEVLGKPKAFRE